MSDTTSRPARLPDAAAVEAVLASLTPASADAELASALSHAFAGFSFTLVTIDDVYRRDTRSTIIANGSSSRRLSRLHHPRAGGAGRRFDSVLGRASIRRSAIRRVVRRRSLALSGVSIQISDRTMKFS
jgi:hypothetical protein